MTTTETVLRKHSIKWWYVVEPRENREPWCERIEPGMKSGEHHNWVAKCSCGWHSRGGDVGGDGEAKPVARRQANAHKAQSEVAVERLTSLATVGELPLEQRSFSGETKVIAWADRLNAKSGFTFRYTNVRPPGFKAKGDCVTRALALALDRPYHDVLDDLNSRIGSWSLANGKITEAQRQAQVKKTAIHVRGTDHSLYEPLLAEAGWRRFKVETYDGPDRRLTVADLPMKGTWIVTIRRHMTVICDGVLYDRYDCSAQGRAIVEDVFGLVPTDENGEVMP